MSLYSFAMKDKYYIIICTMYIHRNLDFIVHLKQHGNYLLLVRARIAVYGSICEQIRNKGFSTGMCCP